MDDKEELEMKAKIEILREDILSYTAYIDKLHEKIKLSNESFKVFLTDAGK